MDKDTGIDLEEFWAKALKFHWGIEAKLSRLPGELDHNFLAQEKAGAEYILKIMRPDCPDWLITAQIDAINHLNNRDITLKVPRVWNSLAGTSFIREEDWSGNERVIWVQNYISGKCLAEIKQKSTDTSFDIGVALGNIDHVLTDYENENLIRDFKWNLMRSLWIKKYLSVIENSDRLEIISKLLMILRQFYQNFPVSNSKRSIMIQMITIF